MDVLDDLTLLVKAAQREGDRRTNEALRDIGLTAAQAEVLLVLDDRGSLSLNGLGSLLVAEGGHPTRLVDRLVNAGLVDRRPAPGDRRRVDLTLTAHGARLATQARARMVAVKEQTRARLNGHDLEAAVAALQAFLHDSHWGAIVEKRRRLTTAP